MARAMSSSEPTPRRVCPVCPQQALTPLRARDVEVDLCPGCQGLWFDRGELELFPDRPSVREFLLAARQAPSRCKRLGHLVPRAEHTCASCRSAPVACPACRGRLSLVVTSTCTIDVCLACEGVWLDRGELELLERLPPAPPAASAQWEVPEPAAPAPDPWHAPGAHRPLPMGRTVRINSHTPLECEPCGELLTVREAYVRDGDVYCGECRPRNAVSGAALPPDVEYDERTVQGRTGWGRIVSFLLQRLR
jgi:Zn-finger nucleic acid-binding protein